jgi:hypothetical protein
MPRLQHVELDLRVCPKTRDIEESPRRVIRSRLWYWVFVALISRRQQHLELRGLLELDEVGRAKNRRGLSVTELRDIPQLAFHCACAHGGLVDGARSGLELLLDRGERVAELAELGLDRAEDLPDWSGSIIRWTGRFGPLAFRFRIRKAIGAAFKCVALSATEESLLLARYEISVSIGQRFAIRRLIGCVDLVPVALHDRAECAVLRTLRDEPRIDRTFQNDQYVVWDCCIRLRRHDNHPQGRH